MNVLRLANPWALALLPAVWAVVLYAALARKGPAASWRRPLALLSHVWQPSTAGRAALTCLATGFLVVALAGPSVRLSREGGGAVCLVQDVSPSMNPQGSPALAGRTLALYAQAVAGRVGLVQFDGRTVLAIAPGTPDAARLTDAAAFPPSVPPQPAAETDIDTALAHAASTLPAGQGVLVLYTDARETCGDAVRAAERLAARGIRIFAVAPALQPRDVRITAIAPPAKPAPGKPVTIEVRLASTVRADVTVTLERLAGGAAPAARWQQRASLDAGLGAALLFDDTPPAAGTWHYRAEVTPADDWPENNRASCVVRTGHDREILYVHAGPAPGPALPILQAAAPAGVRLRVAPAEGLPAPAAEQTTVVLDNVSAWTLGPAAAARLAQRVTQAGMGLLVLGGDSAFAAGGYGDSPINAVLPVTSRTGERPPLELVLVMDCSGSMNESADALPKLAVAKQAVLALWPALGEADRLAIVAFAGESRVVSPLVPVAQWEDLRRRLLEMAAGGGTRITPAVEAALRLFPAPATGAAAGAKTVRHVLLLSDGRSEDFDVSRLAADCREGRLTLSVVATGRDADRDRLGRLAKESGGRLYAAADFGRLGETFLKDMAWARGEGLREEPRRAAWNHPEPIWRTTGGPLPAVDAWNATRAKDGADVPWAAAPADAADKDAPPLLAAWRRGLGKAAAMPWAVGQASGDWTSGDALARHLGTVLNWLASPMTPPNWTARLTQDGGRWRVRVEESAAALPQSAPTGAASPAFAATIFPAAAGEASRAASLEQVRPGIYDTDLGPVGQDAAEVVVRRADDTGGAAHLAVPGLPPREYEELGLDRNHLAEIIRAGGGEILTAPQALAELLRKAETRESVAVGIHLVWAAAAAVVLQAALRLAGKL